MLICLNHAKEEERRAEILWSREEEIVKALGDAPSVETETPNAVLLYRGASKGVLQENISNAKAVTVQLRSGQEKIANAFKHPWYKHLTRRTTLLARLDLGSPNIYFDIQMFDMKIQFYCDTFVIFSP